MSDVQDSNARGSIQSIFGEALAIDSESDRLAYLEEACRGDDRKRHEVERLLNAHDRAGNFLPNFAAGDEPTIDQAAVERVGSQIGPYKLLELLGEGAFGSVYMAEQRQPVRRKVALKVLKPGMDTKSLIARFEAEKQALAMMEHPNIARVFDAGATPSGRPYFVMELVKGLPITKYADQKKLTTEERLEIFVSVCHAVQHAHQKGIIHRDIKPSNVMVARHDDRPVVKVIDFGIAKALHQPLTERTLFTGFGQVVGTVLYMSPEQAEMNALDVDTRSDVYSLGVLLYELLTGVTPHDRMRLLGAAFDEMRNIIRSEEPPRPSTRVSTLGDSATEICEHRKTEPKRLSSLMRGDLDWIVMRALEKDRTRRYDMAKDLASDIDRYLNHEPVKASPPSALYRSRKFIRRNQGLVAMAATCSFLLALLCGNLWYTSVTNARAKNAELQAEIDRREKIEQARLLAEAETREQQARKNAEDLRWRNDSLVIVRQAIEDQDWLSAFTLAAELRTRFPQDKETEQYLDQASFMFAVAANRPEATVSIRRYNGDADWQSLGNAPVRQRFAKGVYRWKMSVNGSADVEGIAGPDDFELEAVTAGSQAGEPGMIRVAAVSEVGQPVVFWIDRFEIRNRDFAEFIGQGGYHRPKYWKHPFRISDRVLSFEEAIDRFRDSTEKLGPGNWVDGSYPPGEEELPVTGICWYEAAAYAQWAGKQLPTLWQWRTAASVELAAVITPESNFRGYRPAKVGQFRGISKFGAYDMAGNAAEWCVNSTTDSRKCVLGGAFNTASYMFNYPAMHRPLSRPDHVGFRCVKVLNETGIDGPVIVNVPDRNAIVQVPPPPSVDELNQSLQQYEYLPTQDLNDSIVRSEPPEGTYRHEMIQLDAAYDGPPLRLHMLLPKSDKVPHNTIVYFPGIGAKSLSNFSDTRDLIDRQYPLQLVMRGWAVCWPEYRGTFSRASGQRAISVSQKKELVRQQVLDLRQAVDYLETRPDLDTSNLVYYGLSWGANIGPLMLVAEPRFSAAVFVSGALWPQNVAEPAKYVAHVSQPVLMINCPNDRSANTKALFDHLGSTDKTRELAGSGHLPPVDFTAEKIAAWLSSRFGSNSIEPSRLEFARQQKETGEVYYRRNRYALAEACFQRASEGFKEALGEEHPETLGAFARMFDASLQREFSESAVSGLNKVLKSQIEKSGSVEDLHQTQSMIVEACVERAWDLCLHSSASKRLRGEALKCAIRAQKLDPDHSHHGLLGFAYFRIGDEEAAMTELSEALADPPELLFAEWLLAAMLHHKHVSPESGQDWYLAVSERIRKKNIKWQAIHRLRGEAADLLGLSVGWPTEPWDIDASIEAHTRLIDRFPSVAALYEQRGSHFGRLGKWDQARADYSKGLELDPSLRRVREAEFVVTLFSGDSHEREKAMESFLASATSQDNPNALLDIALAYCLTAENNGHLDSIETLMRRAIEAIARRPFVDLVEGMLLYRQRSYEEALAKIPVDGFTNPKDVVLAKLFRAMAHQRLGDAYRQKLLGDSKQYMAQEVASPGGSLFPYQDRPVVWCMAQLVLQEAESVIGSDTVAEANKQ